MGDGGLGSVFRGPWRSDDSGPSPLMVIVSLQLISFVPGSLGADSPGPLITAGSGDHIPSDGSGNEREGWEV